MGSGASSLDDGGGMKKPECVVCFECYDTDRRLPMCLDCGHDICRSCTPSLLTGTQIVCPTCRRPTDVPGGDVSKLRQNYGLKGILEKMCANCGNQSLSTCSFCNSKVCDRCLKLHRQCHNLLTVVESALDPAVDMDVKFSRVKEDTRKIFDRYILEARRAREGRLTEIDQVLDSNRSRIQTWRNNLPSSLTTEGNQLKGELKKLLASNFTKNDLITMKVRADILQSKLDEVTQPFITHTRLEIHTDLTSQIAESATLNTTSTIQSGHS